MLKLDLDKTLKILQIILFSILIGYFALLLIEYFSSIIALLISAALVAYISNQLIAPMVKRGISVGGAIAIVYTLIVSILVLTVVLLLPSLIDQTTQLINNLPDSINNLENTINKFFKPIQNLGLKINLPKLILNIVEYIQNGFLNATANFPSLIVGGFTSVLSVLIVIIISIYLLLDFKLFWSIWLDKMGKNAPKWEYLQLELAKSLRGFVKGQIFSGIFMMSTTIIVYSLIGLNYGVVAGVILGTMEIIPYFGTFIGYLPVIFLSLSQGFTMFFVTIILTIIIQQIKDNFLIPKVVSESIGIHPLGIIISILIGAKVAGILGMFLAIPLAGIVQALINVLLIKDFNPEEATNNDKL